MSLVDHLKTRTLLELAKELAHTAHENAKLREQVKRLEVALVYQSSPAHRECEWHKDCDDTDEWESSCGETWVFLDGGPEENRVKFCQGCGKPVKLEVKS